MFKKNFNVFYIYDGQCIAIPAVFFQPQSITACWLVPNYTACRQKQVKLVTA